MKKRNKSGKSFKINSFLRIVKKGQIIKMSYPDVVLRKINQRLERLEVDRAIKISESYYSKIQIEKSTLYSHLAILLSIISFIFSIWK